MVGGLRDEVERSLGVAEPALGVVAGERAREVPREGLGHLALVAVEGVRRVEARDEGADGFSVAHEREAAESAEAIAGHRLLHDSRNRQRRGVHVAEQDRLFLQREMRQRARDLEGADGLWRKRVGPRDDVVLAVIVEDEEPPVRPGGVHPCLHGGVQQRLPVHDPVGGLGEADERLQLARAAALAGAGAVLGRDVLHRPLVVEERAAGVVDRAPILPGIDLAPLESVHQTTRLRTVPFRATSSAKWSRGYPRSRRTSMVERASTDSRPSTLARAGLA